MLLTCGAARCDSDEPGPSPDASDAIIERGQPMRIRVRCGFRLEAADGNLQRATATAPIPFDWPEQQVELVESTVPDERRVQSRRVGDTAQQMVVSIPSLARGGSVTCVRTYEVTRWTQRLTPDAASRIRAVPAARVRTYLTPSEGIESTHAEIRQLASEATEGKAELLERAAAIFAVTRERIKYVESSFGGALKGLRAGEGDCEELSCLFAALCRASGIPARLVRGPNHSWAEFAVLGPDDKIIWIPADPAKEREIGVLGHRTPIIHKGDRFTLAETPGRTPHAIGPTCSGVGSKPRIEAIEEFTLVADKLQPPR